MFGPHRITPYGGSRAIAFEHKYIWLGGLCVNELAYGRELRNEIGEFDEDNYCLMLPCDGHHAVTVDGKRVEADANSFTIINPSCPITLEASEDYRNVSVRISRRALDEAIFTRTGRAVTDPICFMPHPQPLAAATRPLHDLVMQMWHCCDVDNAHVTFSAMGRELEGLLASMVLLSVPNNYSRQLAPASQDSLDEAAGRAAEFLRDHAREDVSLNDVVAVTGVGKSALYGAFRRKFGVTPMEYLRNERLRLAHLALSEGQGNVSVTQVAIDCGFQHVSRFSGYYRQRYNELPSATLARNKSPARP